MIKSGTDFREFSLINMSICNSNVNIEKIDKYVIDSKVAEKKEITDIVNSYLGKAQTNNAGTEHVILVFLRKMCKISCYYVNLRL